MRLVPMLLLASVGCVNAHQPSSDPPPTSPTAVTQTGDQSLSVRVGESASVSGTSARVVFDRVSTDSRCPTGVSCIWEGDAVVELTVESAGSDPVRLSLHSNTGFEQRGSAHGLTIALERLDPHPKADAPVPADAYVAALRLATR